MLVMKEEQRQFGWWRMVIIIIMEINMNDCDQVLVGAGEMAAQLNFAHQDEGLNLELISSPAVDQPLQSLTVLERQLQILLPSQQHSHTPQPSSVSDLSCKSCLMTAPSAPLSLQAFLLEIQEELVGRHVPAPPQLTLKLNRNRRRCTICQQLVKKYQVVAHLRCKHVYHPHCLGHWQQRSSRCPLCRKHFH